MLIVQLQPVANQTLATLLANQSCQLNVYQKNTGLYMDVLVDNKPPVVQGMLCMNHVRIVQGRYLGFQGDFVFYDTQGSEDPFYTGLGGRFQLVYIEPAELGAG